MTEDVSDIGPLKSLRSRVVSLAGARFEKYYHHSTGTHIVKQLEGTEFRSSGVKGYGDFADLAYSDYLSTLTQFVREQKEEVLRVLEARLSNVAPIGERKVELHVQLPDALAEQIRVRAKERNVSLGSYVNSLLDRWLPFDIDDSQIAELESKLVRNVSTPAASATSKNHTFTVPVAQQGFERLERFVDNCAARNRLTVNDVLLKMLQAQESGMSMSAVH